MTFINVQWRNIAVSFALLASVLNFCMSFYVAFNPTFHRMIKLNRIEIFSSIKSNSHIKITENVLTTCHCLIPQISKCDNLNYRIIMIFLLAVIFLANCEAVMRLTAELLSAELQHGAGSIRQIFWIYRWQFPSTVKSNMIPVTDWLTQFVPYCYGNEINYLGIYRDYMAHRDMSYRIVVLTNFFLLERHFEGRICLMDLMTSCWAYGHSSRCRQANLGHNEILQPWIQISMTSLAYYHAAYMFSKYLGQHKLLSMLIGAWMNISIRKKYAAFCVF